MHSYTAITIPHFRFEISNVSSMKIAKVLDNLAVSALTRFRKLASVETLKSGDTLVDSSILISYICYARNLKRAGLGSMAVAV